MVLRNNNEAFFGNLSGFGTAKRDDYMKTYLGKGLSDGLPNTASAGADFTLLPNTPGSMNKQIESRFNTEPAYSFAAPSRKHQNASRTRNVAQEYEGMKHYAGSDKEKRTKKRITGGVKSKSAEHQEGVIDKIKNVLVKCDKCCDQLDLCLRCVKAIKKLRQPPPPPPLSQEALNKIYKELSNMKL